MAARAEAAYQRPQGVTLALLGAAAEPVEACPVVAVPVAHLEAACPLAALLRAVVALPEALLAHPAAVEEANASKRPRSAPLLQRPWMRRTGPLANPIPSGVCTAVQERHTDTSGQCRR